MPLCAAGLQVWKDWKMFVYRHPYTHTLGYGYIGARNDTTQQSGQTPGKELEIKKHYCLCQRLH